MEIWIFDQPIASDKSVYLSPGLTFPASVAEIDGSVLTLKNPVPVSLTKTYGFLKLSLADADLVAV